MKFWSTFLKEKDGSEYPDFVKSYLAECKAANKEERLNELRFVVFDTETTSLNISQAKMVSLGAVRCHSNTIYVSTSIEYLIVHNDNDLFTNVNIHGITKRTSSDQGVRPETLIEIFLNYIGGSVLVGHHVTFDIAMVNEVLKKHFGKLRLQNRFLDTGTLAKRIELPAMGGSPINPKDFSLDALLQRYNVDPVERHTALGDAFCTAQLFIKLLAQLRKRGINLLSELN